MPLPQLLEGGRQVRVLLSQVLPAWHLQSCGQVVQVSPWAVSQVLLPHGLGGSLQVAEAGSQASPWGQAQSLGQERQSSERGLQVPSPHPPDWLEQPCAVQPRAPQSWALVPTAPQLSSQNICPSRHACDVLGVQVLVESTQRPVWTSQM